MRDNRNKYINWWLGELPKYNKQRHSHRFERDQKRFYCLD